MYSQTEVREMPDGGIELSSEVLTAVVYPRFGGKIASLKSRAKEWLWTNPTVGLKHVDPGASYDDNFYGGIDQLFPNDLPTCVNGISLPDHGEMWSREWTHDIVADEQGVAVRMTCRLATVPVHTERIVRVSEESLVVHTSIRNTSATPVSYLWVIHPAFQIHPDMRLHLPVGTGLVADESSGRVTKQAGSFQWPGTDIGVDLSRIPEPGNAYESYYIVDVEDGLFRLEDRRCHENLEVHFSRACFPHLWLFLPLGGWRDSYVAVIEPSSGYPTDLAEAVRMDTHSVLNPHEVKQTELMFRVVPQVSNG